MKARGSLRVDLDSAVAAKVIYGLARNNFLIFVVNDDMTEGELEIELRNDFGMACRGFL